MNKPHLNKLLNSEMSRKEFILLGALGVGSIFGIAGIIKELTSHAATAADAVEPEDGTTSNTVSDTTSSGGSAVKFAPAATGTATSRTMLYNAPVAPLTGALQPARYQISATVGNYSVEPSPTGSGVRRTVEQYGAVGNGTTDDAVAINNAFKACGPGDVLVFAAGKTYAHGNALTDTQGGHRLVPVNTGFTVYGYNSTLLALNDRKNALCIQAANSTWIGLEHKVNSNPNGRSGDNLNDSMWAITRINGDGGSGQIAGIRLFGIKSTNSPAAGIFFYHVTNYTTTDVTVTNSQADGLHNTSEATYFMHNRPNIVSCGDDGVAVVSYVSDARACAYGEINRPFLGGNGHGRGFTVVGGNNIAWNDINANHSNAAGVLIGDENDADHTYPVSNVVVSRGLIKDCNVTRSPDQGSIILTSSYPNATQKVTNVLIDRVTVNQSTTSTTGFVGGGYITAKNGGNTSATRPEFVNCAVTNSTFTGGHDKAPAYYSDQGTDGSQGVDFRGMTINQTIPADSNAVAPNAPGSASYISAVFPA